MDERNILFKCLNCGKTFEINLGDFVNLRCPKCKNKPTDKHAQLFRDTIKNIYAIEETKESFGFDFQYPSVSIF